MKYLRLAFNTVAAASLAALLVNLAGLGLVIGLRWQHYWKSGHFGFFGALSAAASLGENERTALRGAIWSVVVPAVWVVDWMKRRSDGAVGGKRCLKCGYDLQGTPERCPECGEISKK